MVSSIKNPFPIRNNLSIWPIFSVKDLVVVDISTSLCGVTVWIACLFGFGMQGLPEVERICCTENWLQ